MGDTTKNLLLGPRFADALLYAEQVHRLDVRKGTQIPYISHVLAVASIVLELGGDEDEAIAALLHDTAEDHGGERRLADIRQRFGGTVERIVRALSDSLTEDPTKKAPWKHRKQAYLDKLAKEQDNHVLRVSLADKLHNARAIVADQHQDGLEVFGRFKPSKQDDRGEPLRDAPDLVQGWRETVWYYEELVKIYERSGAELSEGARELSSIVAEMHRVGDGATT